MASSNYAKTIVKDVIRKEIMGTLQSTQHPVDLALVVATSPSVKIKPYSRQVVYDEDDIVWGFAPNSLSVGDSVILNRTPSEVPIAVNLANSYNQDPTLHPEGKSMKGGLVALSDQVQSWHPYVVFKAELPPEGNQIGDTRLVLEENLIYVWHPNPGWEPVGTDLQYIADALDVEITDPQTGDFLRWNGTKWVNEAVTTLDIDALPLSGGTLTGNLTMSSGTDVTLPDAPVADTDAVNKKYVDDLVTLLLSLIAGADVTLIPTAIVATDYSVTVNDQAILVNSTNNPVTITLPANHSDEKVYEIKDWKGTSDINNIIVVSADGDTIDLAASFVINSPYFSLTIVSDGSNWSIV